MPVPPKIRLEDTRIRSLEFKVRDVEGDDDVSFSLKIDTGYKYEYKKKKLLVVIDVLIDEETMPFRLHVEFQGLFTLNKSIGKEKVKPFAEINCPAIIFPFLRESVADITRRAGFPPLYLPVINFVELAKQGGKAERQKLSNRK